MKKKLLPLAIVLLGFCKAYSQMGINTASPAATLDINAKKATGTSTSVDGVLITRLDRQRAQSMTGVPASTLIYVNSIATGSQAGTAVNIDAVGYYYYDGTAWVKLHNPTNATAGNIYNTDGTLTGNRTVTQGANTLAFTGTQANAFSVDGATFSVDAANDRIGVGTTTPNTKLTVSTPDGSYGFSHTNGTVDLKSHIGAGIVSFGSTTNNDLRLMTNNFHRLSITSAGDVGIGTNAPNTKLTVTTADNNFGFSHTNGTVVLTSYIGSGIGSFGTTSNNDLRLMTNNFPRLSITPGGDVGIGTNAPNTKLTVSTPDNNFGFSHTNGTAVLTSYIGSGIGSFGTTTNNDLRLMTNNFPRLSITPGGNVGVNTSTPQEALHVNGSVQVTGEIKVGGTATTAGSAGLSNQVLVSQGAGSPAVWKDLSAVTGPVNLLTSFSEFVTNNVTFTLSTENGPTLILGAKNGLKVSSPNNIVVIYIDIDAYVNGLSTSAGIAYLFKTNITNSAGTEIALSDSGPIGMDGTNFADTKKANFRSFVFRNVPVGTFNVGIFAQRRNHNNFNGTTSGNNDLAFLPGNVHIYVYEKN
ncbi:MULTISPECIES: hypothetical protein [unclassified Chryseobacterium]|uniref:hypothetical protein n=1 Tax=unclassified Chryseobacterium TaxID=2593645 RepID=UPI0028533ED7|nr:hypothetical protein [Chryseobacterium sp. CFS7]MDR4891132.1 hypothetical protein [Chryseobacterium sp. CFS7]